jgi:hypothetical protein
MRVYTLYLNTKTSSGFFKPTDKSNLNCVRWNINWDTLFPTSTNSTRLLNPNSKCRVKARLISAPGAAPAFSTHKGTLRISGLASTSQNVNGAGVVLGYILPVANPTNAGQWYLECDTTQSIGVEISQPNNPNICVGMYDDAGVATTNALEYELILYFELEEDDQETRYNTNQNSPPF